METMKLKEARILKARLAKDIEALVDKREQVAVVTIMPEENPRDFIDQTVDELTEKIDAATERLLAVGDAIRRANVGMREMGGEENIAALVERAILLRREASRSEALGRRNPRARKRGGYGADGAQLVDVATYDIAKYAARAKKFLDEAEALSARVDKLDLETTVEV